MLIKMRQKNFCHSNVKHPNIQPLMDNTDLANADFRLTQTTFSTRCHQNTSVNIDCVYSCLDSGATARRLSVVYTPFSQMDVIALSGW